MTATSSKAEAVVIGSDSATANAQSAQRARSVARPVPLPLPTATPRDQRGRVFETARKLGGTIRAVSSGAHITGQLPSIHEAQKRVHRAAAKWDTVPVVKALRLGWGYLWLAVAVVPAYAYVVVTEHPVFTLIVAGLIVLANHYL